MDEFDLATHGQRFRSHFFQYTYALDDVNVNVILRY